MNEYADINQNYNNHNSKDNNEIETSIDNKMDIEKNINDKETIQTIKNLLEREKKMLTTFIKNSSSNEIIINDNNEMDLENKEENKIKDIKNSLIQLKLDTKNKNNFIKNKQLKTNGEINKIK
jgi:hypothetical protein